MREPIDRLNDALAGRYRIERELGRGGMATVYLAHDIKHERRVAIKVLRPELAAALGPERFLREIKLTAALNHPHVLSLLDSGEAQGFLYYVMPFVEGQSLRDQLNREKQLGIEDALRIAREVADALDYAHRQGVVHRDIKPENILLGDRHAVVADFGIARAISAAGGEKLTATGVAVGTPEYMSPEQASGRGSVDGRSDVYSLACVLYEMLAGHPPFTGSSVHEIMARHSLDTVPLLSAARPTVPPSLEQVITKALSKVPADRFATAVEFSRALAAPTVLAIGAARASSRAGHRASRLLVVGGPALVLVVGLGWWRVAETRAVQDNLRAVALLPCDDTDGQAREDHLGDRWSEELIYKLFKVGDLRPKSWLSVQRYRETDKSAREIGAELRAGTLVRCRVTEQPASVRLAVELIRADDDRVIWSNVFDQTGGIAAVNAVQSAAALEIARALGVSNPQRSMQAVGRPLTQDSAALRLYRQGRYLLSGWDAPGVRKSIEYFRSAIARDSAFAHAYLGLAEALPRLYGTHESRPGREYWPEVARLTLKAIGLDATIPEAHTRLGQYLLAYAHDWVGAEDEHRRAIALGPSSVDAHIWYGYYLLAANRLDEAIGEFERAVELDPTFELSRGHLARALVFDGQYERALQHIREGMELAPKWGPFHYNLAAILLLKGQLDSAAAVLDAAIALGAMGRDPATGWLYGLAGRRDESQRILDSLNVLRLSRAVEPMALARLYLGLGNREEGLTWLERAYEERSDLFGLLGADPLFSTIRDEPRFQALRVRMGYRK